MRQIYLSSGTVGVTLPVSFEFGGSEFTQRSNVIDLANAHGGRDIGDPHIDTRKIVLKGSMYGTSVTVAQYQEEVRKVHQLITKTDIQIRVYQDTFSDRYMNVGMLQKYKEKFEDGLEGTVAEVELSFNPPDPFWHLAAGSTVASSVGQTTTFSGYNSGNANSFPSLSITAPSATSKFYMACNGVTLQTDIGLSAAGLLEIDGIEGTMDFNGSDWLSHIESGVFVEMVPGTNSIEVAFSSAPPAGTTLSVSWENLTTVGP